MAIDTASLLQALTSSQGDANRSVQDLLLSQLDSTNPTTALLANYLSQQHPDPDADATDDDEDEEDLQHPQSVEALEDIQKQSHKLLQAIRYLRREVDELYAELDDMHERNDALAAALGACYLCWGEDLDCEICGGKGQPGAFLPDADMFTHYILPAVSRRQHQQQN